MADEGDVQVQTHTQNAQNGTVEQSAADYDPSMDRREDESKRVRGEQDAIMVDEDEEMEGGGS
jgi:serine/threonine-protein kinase PRP4